MERSLDGKRRENQPRREVGWRGRPVILPPSGAHMKHDGGMRRNISLSAARRRAHSFPPALPPCPLLPCSSVYAMTI